MSLRICTEKDFMNKWQVKLHNSHAIKFYLETGKKIYEATHTLYFYNRCCFLNIQKNASTSIEQILKTHTIRSFEKNYYFTVLRDPLQRLKSTFYWNYEQCKWPIQIQGAELINFTDCFKDFGFFCHFAPQYLHLKPFENYDIEYFAIDDLQTLREKLGVAEINLPRLNKTYPAESIVQEVEDWINTNRSFVDDFLYPDYQLIKRHCGSLLARY